MIVPVKELIDNFENVSLIATSSIHDLRTVVGRSLGIRQCCTKLTLPVVCSSIMFLLEPVVEIKKWKIKNKNKERN